VHVVDSCAAPLGAALQQIVPALESTQPRSVVPNEGALCRPCGSDASAALILESEEGILDLGVERLEVCGEHVLAEGGHLELLGDDLVDSVPHSRLDAVGRDLVFGGGVLDGLLGEVIELDDVGHHPHRLVEGADAVVLGEAVLLQVVVLDDLGDLEDELVRLGKRVLADELHDLGEVVLGLQDLLDDGAHRRKLGVVGLVPRIERAQVLRVGEQPVERREVLALRELLVEAPEDLDDAEGGGADGVGEVTTGRRHRTHDRDRARARRRAREGGLARALVERGEARAEVRGVSGVGGHLGETAGDLTEGLGPARRRVRHHRRVVLLQFFLLKCFLCNILVL